jgi:hypothetical protein
MGSKGSKPRKPSHSQHLPKVGTADENARLQREERAAIGDVMGISGGALRILLIVGAILIVGGLLALVLFN